MCDQLVTDVMGLLTLNQTDTHTMLDYTINTIIYLSEINCGYAPFVPNSTQNINTTIVFSNITYSCDDHTTFLTGRHTSTITCNELGQWSVKDKYMAFIDIDVWNIFIGGCSGISVIL